MKRLLAAFALCLLLYSPAIACNEDACRDDVGLLAWMNPAVLGSAGAACATPDSFVEASPSDISLGSSENIYRALSFTATASYTLKSITVDLKRVGDPNSVGLTTLTFRICPNSSGAPPDGLGGCSTMDSGISNTTTGLTTSYASYRFPLSAGFSISSGTRYYIVISGNAVGDGSNYIKISYDSSNTELYYGDTDGQSWSLVDNTCAAVFSTSTCVDQ